MLKSLNEYFEIPGWREHPRFTRLDVDGVLYAHGDSGSGGKFPALLQATGNFQSTVLGHFHGAFGVEFMANENNCVFGMQVGWGGDWKNLQFNYGMKFQKKPIVGCGVVIEGKYPYVERMLL